MSSFLRFFFSAFLFAAPLFAAAATPAAPAAHYTDESARIDRIVALLDRRLALMPEIAATKFRARQPVADPARESQVLDQSVADAVALHLDPSSSRQLFDLQIRLARAVQEQLFARWRTEAKPPSTGRDLVKELRPQLDALGRELLPALYLAAPALAAAGPAGIAPRLAPLLRHPGIDDRQLDELAGALAALRFTTAPGWAAIKRIGVLRVGTTGDYAPFSSDRDGTLRGADIALAEALARHWGLTLALVRTTWPTLMEDLKNHRFDLAASGISITAERRRVADFSAAYFFDGKTPIARREDATRFVSLEQIDQPGVRVIVNPGGTNERFARDNFPRASLTVHPDNRTIFDEIAAGRADVMVTDGIEVRLHALRNPALQGTRLAPFTRAGKAMLLPQGSELTARLDTWLTPQIARGEIEALIDRALHEAR